MHLLSTYLDSHLPPDPWFPNGKTFSTQYFLKSAPKNGTLSCLWDCVYVYMYLIDVFLFSL